MPQVQKSWRIAQAGGEGGGGAPTDPIPEGRAGEIAEQPHSESAGHGGEHGGGSPLTHHPAIQYSLSGIVVVLVISLWAILSTRNLQRRNARRGQSLAEIVVEGMRNFTRTSIGPGGEKWAPFIGSLFIFILVSNLSGALPTIFNGKPGEVSGYLFLAPMANISMTLALATVVFFVVQIVALRSQGLGPRLSHLFMPAGKQFWYLAWLFGPLEIITEFIRPISLTLRLFGNIFGEEMIVATIIGLVTLLPAPFNFIPLHFPMIIFGLLTSVVQAGVFSLLTCIYLQLAQAHDSHGAEEHGHDDGHHAEPVAGPEGARGAFAASSA